MYKIKAATATAVAVTALALAGPSAYAAEPSSSTFNDLRSSACKDVMRLSGVDRDIALAFVHGYVLGKKGTTRYDVDKLAAVTDQFLDYCLDHPSENALQSFEKIAK
jgi:hypothetical protein